MCKSGGSGAWLNLAVNPGANLVKDKKDSNPIIPRSDPAKTDEDKLAEEAKQKQMEASRRSRKSTILSATSSSGSTGAKTLLGQ
jgi:hypothetical protein